jgi:hypothetical protein
MRRPLLAILLGLTLAIPAGAQTTSQQAPDGRQPLGGLLNGDQDRDKAVRQAYERGYERGRSDEARQSQRYREPRGSGANDGGYILDLSKFR